MNTLLQFHIRRKMTSQDYERWGTAALQVLLGGFPNPPHHRDSWSTYTHMVPHVLTATAHAELAGIALLPVTRLLRRLGTFLSTRGRNEEARKELERCLRIHDTARVGEESELAETLNLLANVSHKQARYKAARQYLERSVEISTRIYGEDHPATARDLDDLGNALLRLGHPDTAQAHQERALQIRLDHYGPSHPDVAESLNNLAITLRRQGRPAEAREKLKEALRIDISRFGPNHAEVATDLHNLSFLLTDLGEHEKARECLEEALRIRVSEFGPDHLAVGRTLHARGIVHRHLGDDSAARSDSQRALKIGERFDDSIGIIKGLQNLAQLDLKAGQTHEAAKTLRRALDLCQDHEIVLDEAICFLLLGEASEKHGFPLHGLELTWIANSLLLSLNSGDAERLANPQLRRLAHQAGYGDDIETVLARLFATENQIPRARGNVVIEAVFGSA